MTMPTSVRDGGRLSARWAARVLPGVLLATGALVAASDAFAFGKASFTSVELLVPFDVADSDSIAAVLSAVGMAALAIGLHRGKRLAWGLAILIFAAGVPLQLVAMGRTAGGVVAAVALALLTLDRRHYEVRSARMWSWTAWGLLAAGTAAASIETTLLFLRDPTGALPVDLLDVGGAVSRWLTFGDLTEPPSGPRTALILALAIASRVALVAALLAMLRPVGDDTPTLELRTRVLELARQYGRGALIPFQLSEDKRWFCPSDSQAFIAYGRDGRVAVAVGDPVGRTEDRWRTFASFVDECRRRDWVPVVYQASDESLERLDHLGFQASPIGREAIVDLVGFDLAGSRRANLRHTVTRAQRGGLRAAWYPDGLRNVEESLERQLHDVDVAWREHAGPADMGFTISRFSTDALRCQPVAISFNAAGLPAAFVTFRPTGLDGGFVLDLIRREPAGVPGAVELCLAEAAGRLRDAGATSLSLGLAPLSGLDPSGERVEERALAAVVRLIRPFYDVEGLAFFKDKFAPRWEVRYVAVASRTQLVGVFLALARLHLGSMSRTIARVATTRVGPVRRTRMRARLRRDARV